MINATYNATTRLLIVQVFALVLCFSLSLVAAAVDLFVEAGYEGEYTNNTARTDTDKEDEWIHRPTINAGLTHEGNLIQASTTYSARREIHSEDVFDDQTYVTGNANLTWQVLPQRLSFNAFNTRTETSISSTSPDVPDNRQTTDNTGLGASLTIPSFSTHYVQLDYEMSRQSRDKTDSDSNRQSTNLAYVIPFSENRSIQLNANYGDVDFDNVFSPDYISKNGNLQYISTGSNVDLDVSVGYTELERGLQRDDVNGSTSSANLTWRTTGTTSITATFSRSLEDNSLDTVRGIPDYGERFTEDSALDEIFLQTNTQLSLNTGLGHNQITLSGYVRDKDYEDIQSDELRKNISLTISRNLRPEVRGRIYLSNMQVELDDSNLDYDEFRAGISFDWDQIRNLSITTSVTYEKRDADLSTTEYEEIAGLIRFMYALAGQ